MGADPPTISCLAASLQDCQAKVAMTPIQNAARKRDMARGSRPGRASLLGTGSFFRSFVGSTVASTEGSVGNQTTEYSDRSRLSTEPIGTLLPAETNVMCVV